MPSSATLAKQILVVDDDATTRILLRAALRQAGFGVTLAVDGEDALRQFSAQPRDLVMLDVEMPGLSGNEVCARMRAQSGELLPIVMVTGSDDVASIEKAYHSGATDFIAKPINPALVAHRVKYLLRSAQARLDLRAADASNAAILRALRIAEPTGFPGTGEPGDRARPPQGKQVGRVVHGPGRLRTPGHFSPPGAAGRFRGGAQDLFVGAAPFAVSVHQSVSVEVQRD